MKVLLTWRIGCDRKKEELVKAPSTGAAILAKLDALASAGVQELTYLKAKAIKG